MEKCIKRPKYTVWHILNTLVVITVVAVTTIATT